MNNAVDQALGQISQIESGETGGMTVTAPVPVASEGGIPSFGIIFVFMTIAIVASSLVLFLSMRAQRKANRIVRETKKNGRNWRYYSYIFLSRFKLTKAYFEKVRNRLQAVYPADEMAINMKATNMFTGALAAGAGLILFTFIIAKGDIFFIMAGLTLTYVLFRSIIDQRLENMEMKLLVQLQTFIDMIREQYNDCKRVDDSVGNILDKLPYEIGLHATMIHRVLNSTKVEEEAEKYIEVSPNRFFMMLTAISATTMEYGDKLDENKSSVFLKNLNFLKEEVNIEILKMRKNNALFSGLSFVSLGAVFAIKPIEMWAMGNIPEMSTFYKGSYGLVMMIAVFVTSIISYTLVNNLKNAKKDEIREDSLLRHIAMVEPLHTIIVKQVNANYSKALRHDEMLRFTGDRLGINTFILRRYIWAIIVAIVMLALFTTSIIRGRMQQLNDFADAFESSLVPDEEYREIMRETSKEYAATKKAISADEISSPKMQTELTTDIMQNTKITDYDMASLVAAEVAKHVTGYHEQYFRWWFLLIVIAGSIIGYFVPLWSLLFKQRAVQMSMEDEVSQFQTITLILMHVDGINIEKLLEWLERFAYCFKSSIMECAIDLPHNERKALENLREAETFNLFQSYVANLLSIDKVGIENAFSSLETDREYYKKKREDDNNVIIERKSRIAKIVSVMPLVLVFAGYMIIPMAQMALNMMNEINNAL